MPNPFSVLASAAGKIVADGWTAAMLGLWQAGLWVLRLVLSLIDSFTAADLAESGPMRSVYQVTFWVAAAVMLALVMVQLGVAAIRRDGRSLARVLLGSGQFAVVWAGGIAYMVAVLAASRGLAHALMGELLRVTSWGQWDPLGGFSAQEITDAVVATVLGLLGIVVVFSAISYLLVMITVGAATVVLAATGPIAAAGLVSDAGQPWFWKWVRWFHAAAFSAPLIVLVQGIGTQVTTGVAAGQSDDLHRAVGTAVIGTVLICVSFTCPLALFKLLAFVDPSSSSGAAMRAGLSAQGGLTGFLARAESSSSAASATDEEGRSQAEVSGQTATATRFAAATGTGLGAAAGVLGRGVELFTAVGAQGGVIGADITNQAGIGHPTYVPDVAARRRSRRGGTNGAGGPTSGSGAGGDDSYDDGYPAAWLDTAAGGTPGPAPAGPRPSPGGPGAGAADAAVVP
jgi:hypothetical protein